MAVIEKRINKNGTVSYRAKIRLKGEKPISATFEKRSQANQWAQRVESEMRHGRYFSGDELGSKTLSDLIDRYLELELPKKASGRDKCRLHMEWWRSELGHMPLRKVTPSTLAEARDRLLQEPNNGVGKSDRTKTGATVNRYLATLSHALTVAASEWEWLSHNPMRQVRRVSEGQGRVRFLSDDERERLLEACRESACPYLYPVVVLALSTGARYGEIMNLKWGDIDFDRGLARLEKTKNGSRRAIPIAHTARAELEKLYRKSDGSPTDFVFVRRDGVAPMDIRKRWYAAVEAAEIKDFRFHDLRHSAASYLAMNGATLPEIAAVLGHKTLQMVQRYAHLSDQHVAGVVEAMNKKILK